MNFDEFETVGSERIQEVLNGGDFESLSEIEDALIEIRKHQDEIELAKSLKRRRAAFYDQQIKSAEAKEEMLRAAAERCLKKFNEKTVKYPGVGSVSRRNVKGKWNIEDESSLAEHCSKLGIGDDAYEQVWKINKTKMNKVLEELDKNSNLPEGVKREEDRTSLSVSVEREKVEEAPTQSASVTKASFSSKVEPVSYDGIEI